MVVLHLLSYVGGLAAFLFVTLSLASGLLWLAELIEEHSRYAKSIGIRAIYSIIILHILLAITDGLPLLHIIFSIFCHIVYLQNFSSTWPYISLTSIKFIASCCLVVADHFIWFFHFAAKAQEAKRFRKPTYRYGTGVKEVDSVAFMDVAAFFAVCVWFVPLFLFLSLSANDNALPSFDHSAPPSPAQSAVDLSSPGTYATPSRSRSRVPASTSLVKSILMPILSVLPTIRRRGAKNEEGIIAPRTPVRGSPLHSPIQMPPSYFPWGDDSGSSSSAFTSSGLTPDTGIGISRPGSANRPRNTPPPPRRVQSEAVGCEETYGKRSGRKVNPAKTGQS
ncbi:hypothetical protein TREMEDRAFT_67140 [Tremella mesenterica DSM 1558]|uniref:uncharacterized protein n=1 Tax=Tremella mesenterica (strain ATCC 24925 / CBS 8224 / DSM 1558 / NBRC 9311 / NRRL Y-6157 / RJB 2259-6 / UBC 559-6) TaxID=578456 RepID=UPI0003F49C09|nr:uncharacterized protein TREMEDRAFT_67140 [Tremella mesenterica DSM 1558]EIW72930.1 hypothetical protein TREMEDRAFT_67140 [Tremella mesenterica DSM 1558]